MSINYKDYRYFENRPDVVKIFEDLEDFHDFCRLEMCEFNPAHLYRTNSHIYREYLKWKKFGSSYQSQKDRRKSNKSES